MRRFLLSLLLVLLAFPAWAAVNVNTADSSELQTLPGIGAAKAAAIIAYRTEHGPFGSVDDLDNVEGIGPSTLASLRDLVTTGGASAPPSPAGPGPTPPPTPAAACSPVNINTADGAALESLPGIGPSKAAAIVQYRTDHGKFGSCDELDNVTGIGPATLVGLRDCCTVK